MESYADRPMDLADASLVVAAEALPSSASSERHRRNKCRPDCNRVRSPRLRVGAHPAACRHRNESVVDGKFASPLVTMYRFRR